MTASAVRFRRSQEERSAKTRARLLDATLTLLVEVGYARTTTQAVAARAGLSRGAQLHHFPTKVELVVATVRHLADKRSREIRALASTSGRDAALARLADVFEGPLFLAALELWVAARTDPDVRGAVAPLEQEIVAGLRDLATELLSPANPRGAGWTDDRRLEPGDAVELTLDLLRGIGVASLLSDPGDASRRRERLLHAWAVHLGQGDAVVVPPVDAITGGTGTAASTDLVTSPATIQETP